MSGIASFSGGGSTSGGATLAEQQSQTTLLGTIATNTGSGGAISEIAVFLRAILNAIARPIWTTRTGFVRCFIESSTSSVTVASVTNVAGIGGFSAYETCTKPTLRSNWARNVRGQIT